MVRHSIICTEGPHDQAVVQKIFLELGYTNFRGDRAALDNYWEPFVPKPAASANLYRRITFPAIVSTEKYSIAIYAGEGSNLDKNIQGILSANPNLRRSLFSFGVVVDCDNNDPDKIAKAWHDRIKSVVVDFPDKQAQISSGSILSGIFVLPDNRNKGVLDSVMRLCAELEYSELQTAANQFVDKVKEIDTNHWAPFDEDKARCATLVSYLQPSKTNTVSYKNDRWVSQKTLSKVKELKSLQDFLLKLTPKY